MRAGDTAPDFTANDQDGRPRTLSALLTDGPVVLFFYPAAFTPVCTAEACHFRDLAAEFAAVGATRVGISTDPVDRLGAWSTRQSFDFPLLSDPHGEVAARFGVRRGLLARLSPVKRTTFVLDTDRTVLAVIASEVRPEVHADRALAALQARRAARD
ncbi:antioxidant, AhpC/TSA family protein [Rhodococcus ruber BKS 20-38]|uniref:thioredoxin-dependent peroxiredoxin n=1 Tax=Rhodococcus ruber BKS 20-38 TaxID=1278076 RepID=M2XXM1_9NOCA|nr:peroxiredoxin [Rhodococcus ruber]EME65731.1 antioxidant, AhpC/TSA family protein [Rhodococcus ruber BKS 20-38]